MPIGIDSQSLQMHKPHTLCCCSKLQWVTGTLALSAEQSPMLLTAWKPPMDAS